MRPLILFIAAYIVGSVNFSMLLFRLLGKGDPRDNFSGNAGVVNVYRQAGFFLAVLVLLLDISRSMAVAVAIISQRLLPEHFVPWCGLALILGNSFPCFHNFMGGKGVANYLGFTVVVSPVSAVISVAAWGVAYKLFKLPFIASFVMVLILAAGTVIKAGLDWLYITGVMITVLLIIYNHRKNIDQFLHFTPESKEGKAD
jgi:acyl phosphate:glycerol-3-phosphate acyltransferase